MNRDLNRLQLRYTAGKNQNAAANLENILSVPKKAKRTDHMIQ